MQLEVEQDPGALADALEGDHAIHRTVAQCAEQMALSHPERVVIVESGVSYRAAELWHSALRLAGWMREQGIAPGDVVSFQLPNWHEASLINLAAAALGAVIHPIVPIFRHSEVAFMLADSGSKMVFAAREHRGFDHVAMMIEVSGTLADRPAVVSVRGSHEGAACFEDILAGAPPIEQIATPDFQALKLIMYTSGTTGRPKAVRHSHATINIENVKTMTAAGLDASDIMFNASPVTHITGALYGLNLPWFAGIAIVLLDTWNADLAFDLMFEHECTYMAGATPFLRDLVQVAEARGATLPHLRRFTCGGAGVPASLIYAAARVFPHCRTWRAFGATECPTITVMPETESDLVHAAETDGRIWRAEVKVVDPVSGKAVPDGAEGEILVRAANMALGYSNSADNRDGYDEDGFFRTGDLGKIVDVCYLVVTGRKKDLIIRGGENISAREIEEAILVDARILDVAVVGKPSERLGETVCAFVVVAPRALVDLPAIAALISAAGLAKQKTPEHVILVEELPRTAAGKVRKDELRRRAADEEGAE